MTFRARTLIRDVAVSGVAFSIAAAVGLLLVPFFVAAYGLAGYGQIVLARVFLPAAAFGIADLGLGETATQVVASARAAGEWPRAARRLTLVGTLAVGIGSALGIVLVAAATLLPRWFGMTLDPLGMTQVFLITAALLPLSFLTLVLEGTMKGLEAFAAVRAIEVTSTLVYGGLAIAAVTSGAGLVAVCYTFLASVLVRTLLSGVFAYRGLRSHVTATGWGQEDRAFVGDRVRIMFVNKVLGACQWQLVPVLIGALLGTVAVGTFDAIVRFPRFAKAVLGLTSSTVLPVAARLESAADHEGHRRLGYLGILAGGILAIPAVASGIAFSEPLLRLWIGETLAVHWRWQAAMFVIPALATLTSFGGMALLVRNRAAVAGNRIVALQVVIQFTISLATIHWFGPFAFVLGQVAAVAATFVFQMRLVASELGLAKDLWRRLAGVFAIASLSVIAGLQLAPFVDHALQLVMVVAAQTVGSWALCLGLVMRPAEREALKSTIARLMPLGKTQT